MLSLLLALAIPASSASFAWDEVSDRIWLGEAWWANAVQDWRVEDSRVVCTEGRPNLSVRTAQLLTTYLSDEDGDFEIEVELGAVGDLDLREGSLAGIQFGHGGSHVDHRISCLVHHKPAEDGGVLAVVDRDGQVELRDFSQMSGGGNGWSLGGLTPPEAMPAFDSVSKRNAGTGFAKSMLLRVEGVQGVDGYSVTLSVEQVDTGFEISSATYLNVPLHQVDGSIGLVSHLGPDAEKTFWFDSLKVSGTKVRNDDSRAFGPVLASQYTLSKGMMKMTVQMPALGDGDRQFARLEVGVGNEWKSADVAAFDKDAHTIRFRVGNWLTNKSVPYRIVYDGATVWSGVIAQDPVDQEEIVLASLNCNKSYVGPLKWNSNGIWIPHQEIVDGVGYHDPDILYFAGDQIYEGDLTPARRNPASEAYLDYLHKYYRFLWAFRDLMKDRPTVMIPDDHDVYHGNVWGAGGRKAVAGNGLTAQDSGGYTMPAEFVNAVHRSQTSHLPDAIDPIPIEQGISVYFTEMVYGGISFAILGDRMFKDSPAAVVPGGIFKNGWPQQKDYDAREADIPGLPLLGDRQESFLDRWADDWADGRWMKVVLSQTPFANVATIPEDAMSGSVIPSLPFLTKDEYPVDDKKAADGDSNGWPQTARNRAVRSMRKGFALHVTGDQHLTSLLQYGVDDWRDAGFGFCAPAIANTWPRRWMPLEVGKNQEPGAPRYTGDYFDGFGNKMTVWAVGNPHETGRAPQNLYNRVPGYGIVRFQRESRKITMESWPRWVYPPVAGAENYPGWPKTIDQTDNYGRKRFGYLPELVSASDDNPVVQVVDESTGEVLYTLRVNGQSFRPWVFADGEYTVWFGEPGTPSWTPVSGLKPSRL